MKAENSRPGQRRANERFQLRAHAILVDGEGTWPAHLINISAEGALIAVTEPHPLHVSDAIELTVKLNKGVNLLLDGTVVHVKDHYVGLRCKTRNEEDAQLLIGLIAKFRDGEPMSAEYE